MGVVCDQLAGYGQQLRPELSQTRGDPVRDRAFTGASLHCESPGAMNLLGLVKRSRQAAWYPHLLLGLLVTVYAINTIDRQVLALLLEDIKAEFRLSDTQLGLLVGMAFAIFYSTMGIPLARWLDKGSKGKLLAGCILLWSLATLSCGLATSFIMLLIARIWTAIGEAGGSPA